MNSFEVNGVHQIRNKHPTLVTGGQIRGPEKSRNGTISRWAIPMSISEDVR